jgi:hypothetical protein
MSLNNIQPQKLEKMTLKSWWHNGFGLICCVAWLRKAKAFANVNNCAPRAFGFSQLLCGWVQKKSVQGNPQPVTVSIWPYHERKTWVPIAQCGFLLFCHVSDKEEKLEKPAKQLGGIWGSGFTACCSWGRMGQLGSDQGICSCMEISQALAK